MDEVAGEGTGETAIEWRRIASTAVTPPIVQRLPYLEVKLEHSGLKPTGRGGGFFPDAVPYTVDGAALVFYWRPAVSTSASDPDRWEVACATTRELVGFGALPADVPPVVTNEANGVTVVVDGTVGGDATTAQVRAYDPPEARLEEATDGDVELTVAGEAYTVNCGNRRRITINERRVEPVDSDAGSTIVTPELVVRYPGRRELHHPAPGASYRLFPSFGLEIGDLPTPLPVPTAAGELDDRALAASLGVELSERPYPERALWQAFAYTAFDPHATATPELAQLDDGQFVVLRGRGVES